MGGYRRSANGSLRPSTTTPHGALPSAPDGSIRAIQLEAEVSVDPGVLVGDYGLNRQGGRGDADTRRLLHRGADRHEFDQTMADLGDVGLDADNVLRAQLIGFALEAIDRHFAGVVNKTCQFADLAAREGLERRQKTACNPKRIDRGGHQELDGRVA